MKRKIISALLACCLMLSIMTTPASAASSISASDIVSVAKSLVGQYPYVYGGESPSEGGFDCTGLVYYVYHTKLGHSMTLSQARSKSGLLALGTKITNKSDFLPGDIVQFSYPHVAIYIGNNTIIEAATTGTKVREKSIAGRSDIEYAVRLPEVTQSGSTTRPTTCTTHTKGRYLGMMTDHPHQSCFECSVCGATFRDDTTTNTSDSCAQCHTTHTWDDGVVTTKPTLTTTGTKTYTCTFCGETKTETVECLDSMSFSMTVFKTEKHLLLTRSGHLQVTGREVINDISWGENEDGFHIRDYMEIVTSISVGEGVTTLNDAFGKLPNLTTVELPQSLTTINSAAFWRCTSLETINLPKNVSSISCNAFQECSSLKNIYVDSQNQWYCSVDGVLFTKNMTEVVCCAPARSGSVIIPEGVENIQFRAFYDCGKLESVTIPESVTSIDEHAFSGAENDMWHNDSPFNAILRVHSGSYAESYVKKLIQKKYHLRYEIIDECANGHTWDGGVVTTEPTSNSAGVRTYTCTVCGETKTEEIPALGSGNGLTNFVPVNFYSNNTFRDVASNAWYVDNVSMAYQLGLMKGTGDSVFSPGNNMTLAEAVTLAARLHSIYHTGGENFTSYDGGNWYDPYVNYARNNGILSENYNYAQPATREQFVHILAQALPSEALEPIKGSISFADSGSITYAGDIQLLSRAGVIAGIESGGALYFRPHNTITRAEVAAVVTRMAQPGLRVS